MDQITAGLCFCSKRPRPLVTMGRHCSTCTTSVRFMRVGSCFDWKLQTSVRPLLDDGFLGYWIICGGAVESTGATWSTVAVRLLHCLFWSVLDRCILQPLDWQRGGSSSSSRELVASHVKLWPRQRCGVSTRPGVSGRCV